jgi:outer membrane immunogenic protein
VRYRNHGGLSRIGMTKKFLFAAATFATVLAGPAIAADMLVKAPPPPLPPAYSWTGFYLGGNFGYSWGISDPNVNFFDASQFIIASPDGSFKLDGVLGGGQAGYNRQTGNWIWGLEADFQGSGQRGSRTYTCAAGVCSTTGLPVNETVSQQLDWFGTVRGRLGFALMPPMLFYATGGLAYGEIKTAGLISDPGSFSIDTFKTGWTAGAGIEARIVGNWTVKLEYLYMDLGDVSNNNLTPTGIIVPGVPRNGPPVANHLTTNYIASGPGITDNILRIGVNYRFY